MKDGLLTDAYTSKLTDMAEMLESYKANDDGWEKKLQEQIDSLKESLDAFDAAPLPAWDFSKAKAASVIAADDVLRIRPMQASDARFYMGIRSQWSGVVERMLERPEFGEDFFAKEILEDYSFFCIVERTDDSSPVGYVALKDTRKPDWELAGELDGDSCGKGYGARAIHLFLNALKELTGRSEYHAHVAPDNIYSQRCVKKAGFELCGIRDGTVLKTEDDKRRFEDRNLDRIDDNMRALAQELGIEPRQMLSHVLDYRIIL